LWSLLSYINFTISRNNMKLEGTLIYRPLLRCNWISGSYGSNGTELDKYKTSHEAYCAASGSHI
jgi:hypothetical protein